MSFVDPFTLCIISIVCLSLLGLPIGHAMIASSILYLLISGLDMGTASEQLLNGMFSSYILLAVPLFILAAELMNSGTMTMRLLGFCNAVVGRFPGGLALVNVVQSIIFAGMSGSAIADAAGTGKMMQRMMTKDGKYPPAFAAALTRPDYSTIHSDGGLCARIRRINWVSVFGGRRSGYYYGPVSGWIYRVFGPSAQFPG